MMGSLISDLLEGWNSSFTKLLGLMSASVFVGTWWKVQAESRTPYPVGQFAESPHSTCCYESLLYSLFESKTTQVTSGRKAWHGTTESPSSETQRFGFDAHPSSAPPTSFKFSAHGSFLNTWSLDQFMKPWDTVLSWWAFFELFMHIHHIYIYIYIYILCRYNERSRVSRRYVSVNDSFTASTGRLYTRQT